jgi:hypothetical protein
MARYQPSAYRFLSKNLLTWRHGLFGLGAAGPPPLLIRNQWADHPLPEGFLPLPGYAVEG